MDRTYFKKQQMDKIRQEKIEQITGKSRPKTPFKKQIKKKINYKELKIAVMDGKK